jgi:hypothetical protein
VNLFSVGSPEWRQYLERTPHDFFHGVEYHSLSEQFGEGQPWLAVYGGPDKYLAWPYLLKEIDGESHRPGGVLSDATSVYGYSGPLLHGCNADDAWVKAGCGAIQDLWRSQGVVSVFTRFHPLINQNVGAALGATHLGHTVAINVAQSEEAMVGEYDRVVRQQVRKCVEAGFTAAPDTEWQYLPDFVRLYYGTMKRNAASSFYYFPTKYFEALRVALGGHGSLMVASRDGEVGAAALLTEYNGIVNIHLLGSDERFTKPSLGKFLFHEVALWARSRGNRFVHLGGGRAGRDDDSLFRFKAQFSRMRAPFYTGRLILLPEVYGDLTQKRNEEAKKLGFETASEFFPAYRAPMSSSSRGGR